MTSSGEMQQKIIFKFKKVCLSSVTRVPRGKEADEKSFFMKSKLT